MDNSSEGTTLSNNLGNERESSYVHIFELIYILEYCVRMIFMYANSSRYYYKGLYHTFRLWPEARTERRNQINCSVLVFLIPKNSHIKRFPKNQLKQTTNFFIFEQETAPIQFDKLATVFQVQSTSYIQSAYNRLKLKNNI